MIKNITAERLAIAAAAALTLASTGCRGAHADGPEPAQGVVEFDQAVLGFDVPGRVARVEVKRGDAVSAGAALAKLDDTLSRLQRDMRAADLNAARAELALLRAGSRREDVRAADAELAAARTQEEVVRRTLARQQTLVGRGAAPAATLDDWTGQLARTEAERRSREERLHAMRKGARTEEIVAAQARVAAAASALEFESARLSRHAIAAPRAGVVLDVHVEPGEVVAAGAPVVTLADTAHPYIDVFIAQGSLHDIRVGALARVRVDAERLSLPARVEDLGRRTEFTPRFLFSERERPNLVIRVRVRVDDPQGRLHAGVPAFVELP